MAENKTCTRCSVTKPLTKFYAQRGKHKNTTWCKLCEACRQLSEENITELHCKICDKDKHHSEFETDRNTTSCKECVLKQAAEYSAKYRKDNYEKVLASNRKYRSKNPELFKVLDKNYRVKWLEKANERARINYNLNKEDPYFKILGNMRKRMGKLMNALHIEKADHTLDLLDCTVTEYIRWLEYQFTEEMTWKNYGEYWSIDHVTPCNAYDLSNPEEQYECFNWKNTRPCECNENSSKRSKIIPELIESHELLVNKYINEVLNTTLEQEIAEEEHD